MRRIQDLIVILLSLSITLVSEKYRVLGLPLYDILTILSSITVFIFRPWQKVMMSRQFRFILGLLITVVVGLGSFATLISLNVFTYELRFSGLMRISSSLLLFLNVYLLVYRNDSRSELVVKSFLIVAIYQGLLALVQMNSGSRYVGTFNDPNYFGVFLSAVLCILVSLVTGKQGRLSRRIVLYGLIALLGTSLLLTFSRGAYLALFGGLSLVICARMKTTRLRTVIVLGLLIGLAAISLPYIQELPGVQRFSDRLNIVEAIRTGGTGRTRIWREGLSQLLRNPLGYGWGAEPFVLNGRVSHNVFMEVAIQYGLVGLLMVVMIFCIVAREAVRTALSCRADRDIGFASALVSVLVGGISLNMFTVRQFWFVMAMGIATADNLRYQLTSNTVLKERDPLDEF